MFNRSGANYVVLLIAGMTLLLVLTSCTGSTTRVSNRDEGMPVAVGATKKAYIELLEVFAGVRGRSTLTELAATRQAYTVPDKTEVEVIERSNNLVKVRIVESQYKGRTGWVHRDDLE